MPTKEQTPKMIFAEAAKFRFIGLFVAILFSLGMWAVFCEAQEVDKEDAPRGQLKLEGKSVERLVLRREDGRTERFNQPGQTIELREGKYELIESHLKGGYVCFQGTGTQNPWITVATGEPAVLKVGAPLKQTLKVKRRGQALALDYKLLGIGGEAYARSDRSKPPSFVVYTGDKEITSGQFAYG
jgi:hypothetical protein